MKFEILQHIKCLKTMKINYNLKITNDNVKKLIDAINDNEIQKEVFKRYEEVINLLKKFFDILESEL